MKLFSHRLARSSTVIFLSLLAIGLANCGTGAPAFTPTRAVSATAAPQPTADSQSPFNPANGTATPNLTPISVPTFAPGDPNMPVSNGAPITPKTQTNRTQIHGRITDQAGKPVAGARVTVPKASVPVPEMAYLSDADGNYKLSLPKGEFTLAVFSDSFAPAEQAIDTTAKADLQLDWVLKP